MLSNCIQNADRILERMDKNDLLIRVQNVQMQVQNDQIKAQNDQIKSHSDQLRIQNDQIKAQNERIDLAYQSILKHSEEIERLRKETLKREIQHDTLLKEIFSISRRVSDIEDKNAA